MFLLYIFYYVVLRAIANEYNELKWLEEKYRPLFDAQKQYETALALQAQIDPAVLQAFSEAGLLVKHFSETAAPFLMQIGEEIQRLLKSNEIQRFLKLFNEYAPVVATTIKNKLSVLLESKDDLDDIANEYGAVAAEIALNSFEYSPDESKIISVDICQDGAVAKPRISIRKIIFDIITILSFLLSVYNALTNEEAITKAIFAGVDYYIERFKEEGYEILPPNPQETTEGEYELFPIEPQQIPQEDTQQTPIDV